MTSHSKKTSQRKTGVAASEAADTRVAQSRSPDHLTDPRNPRAAGAGAPAVDAAAEAYFENANLMAEQAPYDAHVRPTRLLRAVPFGPRTPGLPAEHARIAPEGEGLFITPEDEALGPRVGALPIGAHGPRAAAPGLPAAESSEGSRTFTERTQRGSSDDRGKF